METLCATPRLSAQHSDANAVPHLTCKQALACFPPQVIQTGLRHEAPAYVHLSPSSSSMRINWLYFALRSERQGAPVLICPVQSPTARSAMVTSSVSPDRCEHITPHPFVLQSFTASIDSLTVPIWFTF